MKVYELITKMKCVNQDAEVLNERLEPIENVIPCGDDFMVTSTVLATPAFPTYEGMFEEEDDLK